MSGARVLVVDDDLTLLEALPELMRLRIKSLSVDTCDMAEAALDRITTTDYDAIVADLRMPGMDGLELLGKVKTLRPDTPTLLITGHGDYDLAVQALRAGAYDYITKPIDRDYFVASLERAIGSRRVSRDVAKQRLELEDRTQDLERCIRDGARELRELLHSEWTTHAELHLARHHRGVTTRQQEPSASLIAQQLAIPLTTIRRYAELLGRADPSTEAWEQARSSIISEARRMAQLLDQCSHAAHVARRSRGRWDPCDLVEIVDEHVDMPGLSTDGHGAHLDAPSGVPIDVNRDALR
jgi:FixJ family two-component response regulator